MASAHIVEVGDRAAGIVVREHSGFRFFASERAFHPLEGALFRTVDQAARAARECVRPRKPPSRLPLTQPEASIRTEPQARPWHMRELNSAGEA